MSSADKQPKLVVRVQAEPFDIAAEIAAVSAGRTDIGAVATFTGFCRDEGGVLSALEIEHYPGMAEKEIGRVVDKALERWPLEAVTVIHRHGRIVPGDGIVLVVTAGYHRAETFAAAEFLMDYLKTSAPFWKRQQLGDGALGGWVSAKTEDDEAAARWAKKEGGSPEPSPKPSS